MVAGLRVTKIPPMEKRRRKRKTTAATSLKRKLRLPNRTQPPKMVESIWILWLLIMRRWMLVIPITKPRRLGLKVSQMKIPSAVQPSKLEPIVNHLTALAKVIEFDV